MKAIKSLLVLSLFVLASCSENRKIEQYPEYNRKYYDLRGEVKSVETLKYSKGLFSGEPSYHKTFHYNKEGNIVKIEYYFENEVDHYDSIVYNAKNLPIKEFRIDSDGSSGSYDSIVYNANKLPVKEIYVKNGKLFEKRYYEYSKDLLVKEVSLNSSKTTGYFYDNNGFLVKKEINKEDDGMVVFEYENNLVGMTVYEKFTSASGEIAETYIEYNDLNKREEKEFYVDGEHRSSIKWEYDEFGNYTSKSSSIQSTNRKSKETYRYEYDRHNNWIVRERIRNGKTISTEKRVITYY